MGSSTSMFESLIQTAAVKAHDLLDDGTIQVFMVPPGWGKAEFISSWVEMRNEDLLYVIDGDDLNLFLETPDNATLKKYARIKNENPSESFVEIQEKMKNDSSWNLFNKEYVYILLSYPYLIKRRSPCVFLDKMPVLQRLERFCRDPSTYIRALPVLLFSNPIAYTSIGIIGPFVHASELASVSSRPENFIMQFTSPIVLAVLVATVMAITFYQSPAYDEDWIMQMVMQGFMIMPIISIALQIFIHELRKKQCSVSKPWQEFASDSAQNTDRFKHFQKAIKTHTEKELQPIAINCIVMVTVGSIMLFFWGLPTAYQWHPFPLLKFILHKK